MLTSHTCPIFVRNVRNMEIAKDFEQIYIAEDFACSCILTTFMVLIRCFIRVHNQHGSLYCIIYCSTSMSLYHMHLCNLYYIAGTIASLHAFMVIITNYCKLLMFSYNCYVGINVSL